MASKLRKKGIEKIGGVPRGTHKSTKQALIESEKMVDRLAKELQTTFDSIGNMVSIQDRDYKLVRVNKAFENALKTNREELIGKKCYEVIHGTSCPVENCPHKQTLAMKQSITTEVFEPRLNICLEVSTSPIFDESGEIWGSIHIAKDITERKRAEEKLRKSEEQMRLKLDSVLSPQIEIGELDLASIIDIPAFQSLLDDLYTVTRMGIGIIDTKGKVLMETGWQDICTKYHRINPHTLKNCIESDVILTRNLKPGEYRVYKCKNNLWDVVTPIFIEDKHIGNIFTGQFFYDDEAIDYNFFATQAETYGFDKEAYLEALKRIPRWNREKVKNLMAFYAKLARMISDLGLNNLKLARVMTEQKRIEETLKESQHDLNHAQEVSRTGSWRLDLKNNRLVWSDETYRIFGIPSGQPMTYETFLSTIFPEDREYVDQKWNAALSGENYDIEHRILAGDQVKWVHEKAELEFDERGKLKSGFGTVQDITELKQAEESLKRYNQELEAFSYSVSHDLRQPLRALDGFSQAVIEDYADKLDEKGKDYLNRVRSASQRMSGLIDGMLKLSRITRTEIYQDRINLSSLALTLSEEVQALQPEREIDFVVHPDITVTGDRQLLRIALRNLLENAWKFTDKCPQPRIEFGITKKNGENIYFIKDSGVGFDMRYADKLFQPFQRLHSSREFNGTGIGLAIVQRIIQRHGGRIWAESETDKGCTFFFTLG